MSTAALRVRRRWFQRLAPALGLTGIVAAAWWTGRSDAPAALTCDATVDELAARLEVAEADGYWHIAFVLGEEIGAACPTLDAAVAHAAALPPRLHPQFFDGLGHGFASPLHDLSHAVADIHNVVPAQHQLALTDGLAIHLAVYHRGQPEPVQAAIVELAALGISPSHNGVRIGLQRALGDDLDTAIATALRYPEDWHGALLEELGWRAGEDLGAQVALPLGQELAPLARCALAHGILRGSWHRADDPLALVNLVGPEDPCHEAWLHATAWVLTEGGLSALPGDGVVLLLPSGDRVALQAAAQRLSVAAQPMWTW